MQEGSSELKYKYQFRSWYEFPRAW